MAHGVQYLALIDSVHTTLLNAQLLFPCFNSNH